MLVVRRASWCRRPFEWSKLKPTTPFGQLPLMTMPDGAQIAQTVAIINVIAKMAGTEGTGSDFAMSQMLIAEGEVKMDKKRHPSSCVPLRRACLYHVHVHAPVHLSIKEYTLSTEKRMAF